jgi:hypothetical protein
MPRFHPLHLSLRKTLVLFLSLGTILNCLIWPSRLPGRISGTAAAQTSVNYIDNSAYFVEKHYADFLSREPDAAGLQFWTSGITTCGSNAQCVEVKRINTSAAFFLSIEFQETGYLVYRTHKVAFGNIPNKPVPITQSEMFADMLTIRNGVIVGVGNWQQQLEQNQSDYFDAFVTQSRFQSLYPSSMTPAQFVDALNVNASGALSSGERNSLVADLTSGAKTRAQALRAVASDADLNSAEFNRAFVLMQYFGYLRRNPDDPPDNNFNGYNFWLNKLNSFNGDFVKAEMVKAFLSSTEYRNRFAQPTLSAFSNPADPLILRAQTAKGETIDYFGGKDAQGKATSLTSVRVSTSDNKVTNIGLDSQARPTQIHASNGVSIKITWLSSTNILVTAITADGAIQANTTIDFTSLTASAIYRPHPSAETSGVTRNAALAATRVDASYGRAVRHKDAGTNPSASAAAGISQVNVTRCGNPVNDADVGMTVIPSSNPSNAFTLPATFAGSGQYNVSIPSQPSPGEDIQQRCEDIAGALGHGCEGLEALPPGSEHYIAARLGLAVAEFGPEASAAVFAGIEVGFAAARLYCETLGYSPAEGAPDLAELLCGGIGALIDRFAAGDLHLIPIVSIPGKGVVDGGSGATVPSSGSFPTFNVDAGGKVEIASFTTSPADPDPFQSYVAEALIECAPQGTQVTISMVGTDGFTKSATATIQGDANVTLTVPGAEAGVMDTITIAVSNGPTKRIAIVF